MTREDLIYRLKDHLYWKKGKDGWEVSRYLPSDFFRDLGTAIGCWKRHGPLSYGIFPEWLRQLVNFYRVK